ncbi:unnamed protein product [Amoebophrya sp. A25]|nr:unnamed protein product [Amoebophrya sp. A25]|eukprot:GSA25T00010354001.1
MAQMCAFAYVFPQELSQARVQLHPWRVRFHRPVRIPSTSQKPLRVAVASAVPAGNFFCP